MATQILSYSQLVSIREQKAFAKEAGFLNHIRSGAARALAEEILEKMASYQKIDPEDASDPFANVRHVWTIGVECDVDSVRLLERQIAGKAAEQAGQIVEEAIRRINNWGLAFGWRDIKKDDAARFIREAANQVLSAP